MLSNEIEQQILIWQANGSKNGGRAALREIVASLIGRKNKNKIAPADIEAINHILMQMRIHVRRHPDGYSVEYSRPMGNYWEPHHHKDVRWTTRMLSVTEVEEMLLLYRAGKVDIGWNAPEVAASIWPYETEITSF